MAATKTSRLPARNRLRVRARPRDVYEILTDAAAYGDWVVGAKDIRTVDPGWPHEGARFHHTVGVGPATIDDSSKVVSATPDRRLVLEARFRPLGVAIVVIDIEPDRRDACTLVTMTEYPTRGPAQRAWSRPARALVRFRNAIALRRLRRLAESRARA